ncbi:hypothetical protein [Kitasatospora cinereorecta]|uniref:Uncharacterized protein n=1 Tax=Kitasatospora cinereorecta TaxID=285560 RepID=A0ABW0VIC6_9ACTN
MVTTDPTRTFVVSATQDVLAAGRELSRALADPYQRAAAADRLALVAEAALGGLDDLSVRNFEAVEAAGAVPPEDRESAGEDVLTVALGQLEYAQTLFAAGRAVGEAPGAGTEPGAQETLEQSLTHLGETVDTLTDRSAREPGDVGRSDGLAEARDGLHTQAVATLDHLVDGVSGVSTAAVSVARKLVPGFEKAWEQIGKVIPAGRIAGKLVRTALRAVEAALDGLYRLLRTDFLAAAREKVHEIWDKAGQQQPVPGVVGVLIGVGEVGRMIRGWLDDHRPRWSDRRWGRADHRSGAARARVHGRPPGVPACAAPGATTSPGRPRSSCWQRTGLVSWNRPATVDRKRGPAWPSSSCSTFRAVPKPSTRRSPTR